jgi:ABC-type polysaccharide/polyol phosphate transport system ATPase subunit
VITADAVGVRFLFDRQRRVVTPTLARIRRFGAETWGLRDVSFSIGAGEGVALVGQSGSGKSTLLRLVAGVLTPDEGRLEVSGRVGSLLSTDAGLLSLLTGRENAHHLGVLAGFTRKDARAALDQVKERSALGDYFERPVLSYSQGMSARLGVAVAEERNPNILLLDEVHEALDHEFRGLLERRAKEMLEAGGVVIAAGHDHEMLGRLCNRCLWIEAGRIRADGEFGATTAAYLDGS